MKQDSPASETGGTFTKPLERSTDSVLRQRQETGTGRAAKPLSQERASGLGIALVSLLALACAALQIWLLGARWINPDEGAHLMDASMALRGLVPLVDFGARQPLYVYSYIPAIKLFGSTLFAGRLTTLLETWLTAVLLFQIGRRLWNSTSGAVAALLYIATPSILLNATVAKTEPLSMLLTSLGILALIAATRDGRSKWLVLSGIAFGLGYYVRQSALAGIFIMALALFMVTPSYRMLLRRYAIFCGGMALVTMVVLAWYSRYMSLSTEFRNGSLFPPFFILKAIRDFLTHLAGVHGPEVTGLMHAVRTSSQSWETTLRNTIAAMKLNIPLLLGSVLALVWAASAALRAWRRREPRDSDLLGVTIILGWLLSLTALYAYWFANRGFFPDYMHELVPPMALLSAWVLHRTLRYLSHAPGVLVATGLVIVACVLVYVVERGLPGSGTVLAVGCLGWFGWCLGRRTPFRSIGHAGAFVAGAVMLVAATGLLRFAILSSSTHVPNWIFFGAAMLGLVFLLRVCGERLPAFQLGAQGVLLALAGSAMLTNAACAEVLGPAFDCVWPRNILPKVARVIRENSSPGDTVMSGAVIWEYQAGRLPFAEISHPTAFRVRLPSAEILDHLERLFVTRPPKVIVLDGYTEQSWFHVLPQLGMQMEHAYTRVAVVNGAQYPVQVFVRSSSMNSAETP
jgi:4-amino-4-deoxy-L-arabinose transferase-like glycosyltransferase